MTKPGSHIMVNFKTMDMINPQDGVCRKQWVNLDDQGSAHHSITGGKSLKFCGDLVPNYPGPSTFTSGDLTVIISFVTIPSV